MNKLKLIASSLLMASMLTTASFSMQTPGQAPESFVVDQSYGPTLTCHFEQPSPRETANQHASKLANLIKEVKESEENQNPKYSWMRGKDRDQFDKLMSRDGQIGRRGWNDIADKLAATQGWLANQEIEARYAILHEDITYNMSGMPEMSLKPAKYSILSSADIQEFNSLSMSGSTTLKTIEKLRIAEQWWIHFEDQYMELNYLLEDLTTSRAYSWMTQEDHAAFAEARTDSMAAAMCGSITDSYLSYKTVSEKKAAYTNWLANRHEFRTATIALDSFMATMTPAEHEAFNAAKASTSTESSISDMYHAQKSPAEKLTMYTHWLEAYRQNQVAIIALDGFSTGVDMTSAEHEAFNAAKASHVWGEGSISDMYHAQKSPAEKLAMYTQWLETYRQNQTNA